MEFKPWKEIDNNKKPFEPMTETEQLAYRRYMIGATEKELMEEKMTVINSIMDSFLEMNKNLIKLTSVFDLKGVDNGKN